MCRQRLMEFRQSLRSLQPFKESAAGVGPGISILPVGCTKLEDAVDQFVKRIPEQDMVDLDGKVQEALQTKQKSLARICLSPQAPQLLGELEALMQTQAEKFVAARMRETDAADFFLKQYQKDEDIAKDIAGAFHHALPPLPSGERVGVRRPDEFHILTVPAGPSGEKFADHARRAMQGMVDPTSGMEPFVVGFCSAPSVPSTVYAVTNRGNNPLFSDRIYSSGDLGKSFHPQASIDGARINDWLGHRSISMVSTA